MKLFLDNLFCNLKNGQLAKKTIILIPKNKISNQFLDILWQEGFVEKYNINKSDPKTFEVYLGHWQGNSLINNIKLISKPSKRTYCGVKDFWKINNNLGLVIVSNTKGIMTLDESIKLNLGGEVFCVIK